MNTPSNTPRTALIVGATGLVGRHLLNVLLHDAWYSRIYVVGRSKVDIEHPKLEQLVMDLDKLSEGKELPRVQDVYCCLGTTMKKAGSKEAFRKVDYTYPLALAKHTAAQGAQQFLLVSAMGANKSSLFFYNRVKGDVEEAICKINQFKSIHVFRPSLLLGNRKDERKGEQAAMNVTRIIRPLMVGPFSKYRPIQAHEVAMSMFTAARSEERGVFLHASEEIKKLARQRSYA